MSKYALPNVVCNQKELDSLRSLYLQTIRTEYSVAQELKYTKKIHEFRFEIEWEDFESKKISANPYLHIFNNMVEDHNLFMKKGLCVMYPSSIINNELDAHIKFLGKPGSLLVWLTQQNQGKTFFVHEIIYLYNKSLEVKAKTVSNKLIVNMLKHLLADQLIIII